MTETWFLPATALGAAGKLPARRDALPHAQTRREARRELAERWLFITGAGLITSRDAPVIGLVNNGAEGAGRARQWKQAPVADVFFALLCRCAASRAAGESGGPGPAPRSGDRPVPSHRQDGAELATHPPSEALYGLGGGAGGRADICDWLTLLPFSTSFPPGTCCFLVGPTASACSSSQWAAGRRGVGGACRGGVRLRGAGVRALGGRSPRSPLRPEGRRHPRPPAPTAPGLCPLGPWGPTCLRGTQGGKGRQGMEPRCDVRYECQCVTAGSRPRSQPGEGRCWEPCGERPGGMMWWGSCWGERW